MPDAPKRITADLSAYPDLVVIYLGMRVEEPRGFETLQTLGPQIQAAVEQQPDGLLLHEPITFSEDPLHVGMRQYWRDFEAQLVFRRQAERTWISTTGGGGNGSRRWRPPV
jgi:hypothetical protein